MEIFSFSRSCCFWIHANVRITQIVQFTSMKKLAIMRNNIEYFSTCMTNWNMARNMHSKKRSPTSAKNNHLEACHFRSFCTVYLISDSCSRVMRNQMIPMVIPTKASIPTCACCGFNLNFGYLKSYPGLLKILQLVIFIFNAIRYTIKVFCDVTDVWKYEHFCITEQVIAGLCKSMLMNFGLKYASVIGFSYDAFLSVISSSVITTSILLFTYIWSENSMRLMRSSLFVSISCLNELSVIFRRKFR